MGKKKKKKKKMDLLQGYDDEEIRVEPTKGRDKKIRKRKRAPEAPELPDILFEGSEGKKSRVRHVGHTKGIWAGYIGAEVSLDQEIIKGFFEDFEGVKNHHVSFSKTLYFQQHEIEEIRQHLSAAYTALGSAPFEVSFTHLTTLSDEDKTTQFLALGTPSPCFAPFYSATNKVLAAYGLPSYFKKPIPHVTLGARPYQNKEPAEQIPIANPITVTITTIVMKAGNKVFKFPLLGP
eukprot:TRINITY_DN31209_c0_g1_i1.p1 TRINITY_DN31209_c0_g1~~TRINITY_DN31209_c0_g1_i1.p1  ORF type:complete len:235 (+),score=50.23 TRINITY_DN31209_c0_g1_i1:12-716(+)